MEVIHQLEIKIDHIDDNIDENPIEDIWSSIEDLDTVIVKRESFRTQYKGKYQQIKLSLEIQYKKTYEGIYEEKNKRYKKTHVWPRIFTERRIEAKQIRFVRFSIKMRCMGDG